MTSLSNELGREITVAQTLEPARQAFAEVFQTSFEPGDDNWRGLGSFQDWPADRTRRPRERGFAAH
jgi:hypothetical protein